MAGPARAGLPREISNYLIPTEKIVFQLHSHWIRVAGPVSATFGGLLLIGLVDQQTAGGGTLRSILIIAWLLLLLYTLWQILEWRLEWFLATDRRLVLVHGVIIRRVAMMPLAKVTDMAYNRSPAGKILGYGEFVLESAGQDQALNRVPYVPNPNMYYQTLSAVIFAPPTRRRYDTAVPTWTGQPPLPPDGG
jgi:membrane protein YdbS with pleckstrin-like domain